MKRKLAGLILSVVMAASALTGCGSSGDGADYVKGVLDVAYNQGTESYVDVAGVKEEDAKKYMEQSVTAEAKVMAAYFGIAEPSDEVIAEFKPVVEKLYEGLDYEVKADGDKVKVSSNEVAISISEELETYIDEFNVKAYVDGDASCTDEAFAKAVAEILLKDMGVCGTKTVEVELIVTEKDGKYTISDEDLVKLDEAIIVYP